jgi:hypothetical protein
MSHTESFDRKTKKYTVILGLLMLGCSVFSVSSWAEPGVSDVASSGNGIATNGDQTPILPVPSSETPTSTITVQMQGFTDTPPPASGGGSRAEVVTVPPPVVSAPDPVPAPAQPKPLRTIVESPPPPTPVSPSPVVATGTIAPVQRPDSYSISSFGSASSDSGVPAPQVYNGYQAPPSDFLQGGSNYQAPVRQPTIRRVIVPPVSDRYQAPPSTFQQGGSNYQAPIRQPTVRETQAQLARENSRIIDQARTLYLSGDKQGAERLIQSLPVDEQVYTREYVTHGGGVENVGLTDEQATDITMAILDPRKKGKFVVNVVENIEKKAKKQFFKNTQEATEAAVEMKYRKIRELSNGEAVYKKGNSYITRDIGSGNGIGSHNGGAWKEANSVKNLGTAETRNGTFNADLSIRVGK